MRRQLVSGFSFFELIVVIAIVATSATFAVPSMGKWFVTQGVENTANQFVALANLACIEAMRRNYGVALCGADVNAGVLSSTGCSADGSWNKGILLFQDLDGNGNYSGSNEKIKLVVFDNSLTISAPLSKLGFNSNSFTGGDELFCIGKSLGNSSVASYSALIKVSGYSASIVCRKDGSSVCGGC